MAEISNPINKLSPKQTRAIGALLVCRDIQTAAKEAHVGERTLHTWLQDAVFLSALREAESQAVAAAVRRLAGASGIALNVLTDVMSQTNTPVSVRLRAALGVLDQLVKLRQFVDLEARITELEARLTSDDDPSS